MIEYRRIPELARPMVEAMVNRLFFGLQLDRSWRSLRVRTNGRLRDVDATLGVKWVLLHGDLDIRPALLLDPPGLYAALTHEFVHMATWPFREAIDVAVVHIADLRRRRNLKRQMLRQYEHVSEDMAQMIEQLLPWNDEVAEKLLGPVAAPAVDGELGTPAGL